MMRSITWCIKFDRDGEGVQIHLLMDGFKKVCFKAVFFVLMFLHTTQMFFLLHRIQMETHDQLEEHFGLEGKYTKQCFCF